MSFLIYNVIICILYFVYILNTIGKGLILKDISINKKRLGFFDKELIAKLKENEIIWVHAASVGEINSVVVIIELLKKRFPKQKVLLTTMTETGKVVARKKTEADYFMIIPLDFILTVKRIQNLVSPKAIIIAETELWPNFILNAKRNKIPLFLFSATISEKSFLIYKRYAGKLIRKVLNAFEYISVQSEIDLEKIKKLGYDNKKLEKTGDAKFDNLKKASEMEVINLKKDLFIGEKDWVLLAGSTHEKEEEIILDVYLNLKKTISNLKLILAPRHLNRLDDVFKLCERKKIDFVKRTEIKEDYVEKVIVLDSLGELAKLYSVSKLSFVGGTMVDGVGGHSIWEPLAQGKAVLYGKNGYEHIESMNEAVKNGVGFFVENENDLENKIKEFYSNGDELNKISEKVNEIFEKKQGASIKLIKKLEEYLF